MMIVPAAKNSTSTRSAIRSRSASSSPLNGSCDDRNSAMSCIDAKNRLAGAGCR